MREAYGAMDVSPTGASGVPSCPRIESGPEVATNDVAKASRRRASRSRRLVVEDPARSMSERERRHRHGVPTPSRRSFRGQLNWKPIACSRMGVCTELGSLRGRPPRLPPPPRRRCRDQGQHRRDASTTSSVENRGTASSGRAGRRRHPGTVREAMAGLSTGVRRGGTTGRTRSGCS